jgi:hypothetical protein
MTMPRTNVPVGSTVRTGTEIGSGGSEVTGDSTNNHEMVNDGKTFLLVRNADASPHNVTPKIAKTVDGVTPTSVARSVGASGHKILGPYPTAIYNTTAGKLDIDVDDNNLMLQAFKVGS